MPGLSVLFNGSCPVCRREIAHYQRLAAQGGASIAWCDISRDDAALHRAGADAETARRRLHVIDEQGRVLAGVPAFAAIWVRLPRYRWLAGLVRQPVIGGIVAKLYEPVALLLYHLDRRRRRSRQGRDLPNAPQGER
jgi:predicted DCC family thiol-disulfide oxidoreductase YuxK